MEEIDWQWSTANQDADALLKKACKIALKTNPRNSEAAKGELCYSEEGPLYLSDGHNKLISYTVCHILKLTSCFSYCISSLQLTVTE